MKYSLLLLLFAMMSTSVVADSPQMYEVRSYLLKDTADTSALDSFLEHALLPGMGRLGIGPVGVFTNSLDDENDSRRVVVVVPYDDVQSIASSKAKLNSDKDYQSAASSYLNLRDKTPVKRITSELLVAMDCFPSVKVPNGTLENPDRVYELRLYESANEILGTLKVDMFNNGEVPIFLDSGIQPIFIGQCVVGPQMPSLTYLTVYPNEQARGEAWDAFRTHPDWQVLKKVQKYRGTVSKIDKYVLVPKPYSQM